jgi:hypothetical protein
VVDFGSDKPVAVSDFTQNDKIKIIRVENTDRCRPGLAINIGVDFAKSNNICKFDSDCILVSDGWLAATKIATAFYRGNWQKSISNGQVIFHKENWKLAGGYNEWLSGYGFEDSDFYIRLRKNGVAEHFIDSGVLSAIEHPHELRNVASDLSDEFFSINITQSDVSIRFQEQKNTFLAYLKRWSPATRRTYSIASEASELITIQLAPLPPEYRTLNAFANLLGICFISDQKLASMLSGMVQKLISEDIAGHK